MTARAATRRRLRRRLEEGRAPPDPPSNPDFDRAKTPGPERGPLGSGPRKDRRWRRGPGLAALDGLLELAPRRELRHRGCRDRHLLRRIARVHTLPLLAVLGRELPEPRECDLSATPQRVGDRVEKGIY